jgi:hypothetical protein
MSFERFPSPSNKQNVEFTLAFTFKLRSELRTCLFSHFFVVLSEKFTVLFRKQPQLLSKVFV